MTLKEMGDLIDDLNEIRRVAAKARTNISELWNGQAIENMKEIEQKVEYIRTRIIIEKTNEVLGADEMEFL